jgi:hypothetical protein
MVDIYEGLDPGATVAQSVSHCSNLQWRQHNGETKKLANLTTTHLNNILAYRARHKSRNLPGGERRNVMAMAICIEIYRRNGVFNEYR